MNFKGHVFMGLLFYAASVYFGLLSLSVICLLITLFASLFPDVDIHSHIRKFVIILAFISIMILALLQYNWIIIVISALMLIMFTLKHRTITHNILFALVISYVLAQQNFEYGLSFMIGFMAHKIGDMI